MLQESAPLFDGPNHWPNNLSPSPMLRRSILFVGPALALCACAQDTSSLSGNVYGSETSTSTETKHDLPAGEALETIVDTTTQETSMAIQDGMDAMDSKAEKGGMPSMADKAFKGYDQLLKLHVDENGWVDYEALKDQKAILDAYVVSLAKPIDPKADPSQRLAHLINAYNAFTLKLIVDNGIPDSIMELEGGKPWDVECWKLAGESVSLNQIEHDLIRPVFQEPRIHWALVCAAVSCPPLRNEAYTASDLEDQLKDQEGYVLNFEHPRYAQQVDAGVLITPLFDWYGQDFGDWKAYAAKRLGVGAASFGSFLEYDWKLNSTANRP